jgi:hypothetical protein
VLSTKTYRREPSHRYASNKKNKNQNSLWQKQTKPDITYATTLKSQHNQSETASPQTQQRTTYHQQLQLPSSDIPELKVMVKGLMEQMGAMLNLLTTLVSKMT